MMQKRRRNISVIGITIMGVSGAVLNSQPSLAADPRDVCEEIAIVGDPAAIGQNLRDRCCPTQPTDPFYRDLCHVMNY